VKYELPLPPVGATLADKQTMYIHKPTGPRSRTLDDATEQFVDATRAGAGVE
jgi:hypothetical protein